MDGLKDGPELPKPFQDLVGLVGPQGSSGNYGILPGSQRMWVRAGETDQHQNTCCQACPAGFSPQVPGQNSHLTSAGYPLTSARVL